MRQLEYLDAVGRFPTWAAAADSVGVSPSALSQGIAELERRLGLALFRPEGRRRVPLPQAEPVLAHARRVLAQTHDLATWAAEVRGGRAGRLRVGMIDAAAVDHYPEVLRAFRRDRPEVELHLVVRPSGALLGQLRRDEIDVAICVAPEPDPPDLRSIDLLDEPLVVYGPPGAARRPPVEWGPWVTFPSGSHTRTLITRALSDLGVPVEVVAESHQPEVLAEMVRLGLGWTVLPPARAERGPDPLTRARRRPVATRRLVAARRADALDDVTADALIGALVDLASTSRPTRR